MKKLLWAHSATPEMAHRIGMELCKKILKDEYEFVLSTHIDKGHIHNHIIFNNINMIKAGSTVVILATKDNLNSNRRNKCNLNNKQQWILRPIVSEKYILIGWIISGIGAYPDNFGGDIAFPFIIVIIADIIRQLLTYRKLARNVAAPIFIKMRILWTLGFLPHYGHFPSWDGRIKLRNWIISIPPACW